MRQLACEQRFALIFSTFGSLPAGQALELVNDHDPKPLRNVFQAQHPGKFGWDYLEQGPDVWRVAITKTGAASPQQRPVLRLVRRTVNPITPSIFRKAGR